MSEPRIIDPEAKRPPPDLLVVGHVTRDLVHGTERLGGAASFAARAAACLGKAVGLLTAAPLGDQLLGPLRAAERIDLECLASADITTFALFYEASGRRLRLLSRAAPIQIEQIPGRFRGAAAAYVAPVFHEYPLAGIAAIAAKCVVVGVQGWLRTTDTDGWIRPLDCPDLLTHCRHARAVVFSEQDHPQAERLACELAALTAVVALTRGARGYSLWTNGRRHDCPASPAREIDATGAGDVFGTVLALALSRDLDAIESARLAAQAAARVVEGPEMGNLSSATISLG